MRAVEVGIVARPPKKAHHALLPLEGHVHGLCQPGADQKELVRQPGFAREAAFAFGRVLRVPAMVQGLALASCVWKVDMVLFVFLQRFNIRVQVHSLPVLWLHVGIFLVEGAAQHEVRLSVLWPLCFHVCLLFLLPSFGVRVDRAPDMRCVRRVLSQQFEPWLRTQPHQVLQRGKLVVALNKELRMHVVSTRLLAFQ